MALDIRIQQATMAQREALAAMADAEIREIAAELGISGFETTPVITLRDEIAQTWRDDARAYAYPAPQVATYPDAVGAQPGNPGSDNAALPPLYAAD